MSPSEPPLPKNVTTEGVKIPDEIVAELVANMKKVSFTSQKMRFQAEKILTDHGLSKEPGWRLADRLIQRYRKSGHLTMTRQGRVTRFTWIA